MVRQAGPKAGRRNRVEWSVVSACGRYRFTKPDEARARRAAAELNRHYSAILDRRRSAHYEQQIPYRVESRLITAWVPDG